MENKLALVREVLDNQVVDRWGSKMGKVDGLAAELREGQPPRLAFVEMGAPVLARRLSRRLGDRLTAWRHRRGVRPSGPYRVAWADVEEVGITVQVRAETDATPMMDWELWLRRHVIGRIPGSGVKP